MAPLLSILSIFIAVMLCLLAAAPVPVPLPPGAALLPPRVSIKKHTLASRSAMDGPVIINAHPHPQTHSRPHPFTPSLALASASLGNSPAAAGLGPRALNIQDAAENIENTERDLSCPSSGPLVGTEPCPFRNSYSHSHHEDVNVHIQDEYATIQERERDEDATNQEQERDEKANAKAEPTFTARAVEIADTVQTAEKAAITATCPKDWLMYGTRFCPIYDDDWNIIEARPPKV